MFKNMKLSAKLITLFLCVGIIPALVIGTVTLVTASKDMKDQKKVTFGTLTAVREIKKKQIETYFAERQGDMGVLMETVNTLRLEAFTKLQAIQKAKKANLSGYINMLKSQLKIFKDDPYTYQALTEFNAAFAAGGDSADCDQWRDAAKKYDKRLADINKDNQWYDLFLIHKDGDIVYTVCGESDLGMNIPQSTLKTSSIGKAFDKIQNAGYDEVVVADFAPYSPSNGEPASFMMAQIRDDNNKLLGYAALQFPIDKVNEIMLQRAGMGKTGETYLVGQDGLMRSDSFLDPEGHSVAASFRNNTKVSTTAAKEALAGNDGFDVIVDYCGNPVLSCWDNIDVGSGIQWAMISEMDVAEAFCPVDDKGNEYFAKYIEKYGYYDLFLVNPDGYCFYTVCHESDYQTNFISGKYSSSNLGLLIKEVLQSRSYGLADFAPYAPSNNEPCGFIAQPVVYDGDVELIVALQLPLDAINAIMSVRDGMGRTGESYLIGSDKRMRSDSFLDKEGHSVKASFAGSIAQNGVDTVAANEALSGKTGAKIIMDYNGNPVLSAYAPVKVGNTTWALIAEVDEAEAYAGLRSLQSVLGIIGFITVTGITAISVFFARSITKPLSRIIHALTEGSDQVTSAAGQVSSSSQSLAEGATEQAAGLEETSSSLEEMASMTKQNADNAQQANTLAADACKAADTGNEAMSNMNNAIEDIQKSSDETAKIIKVIDEIAFQTNLLALNAAVEAARAGEAGKGFAVVAEEVRNLAMRSAEAAKDTSGMIEESVKNAKNGVEIAGQVSGVLEEIVGGISKTTDLVAEIAAASKEQSQGIDQVNTAVNQMDKVTQANAANAEESASASEELNAQAEQMNQIVEELSSLIGGSPGINKISRSKPVGKKISVSDEPFHQISKGACQQTQESRQSAEIAIPFENKDFEGFNS